jgi:hypothetical protein
MVSKGCSTMHLHKQGLGDSYIQFSEKSLYYIGIKRKTENYRKKNAKAGTGLGLEEWIPLPIRGPCAPLSLGLK